RCRRPSTGPAPCCCWVPRRSTASWPPRRCTSCSSTSPTSPRRPRSFLSPTAETPMLDLLAGFIQELRAAGLPVSLTENLDAMEAVQHVPIDDREAFKYALAATLVKNHAHWKAFETVFEVYFSLRGAEFMPGDGEEGSAADLLRQ